MKPATTWVVITLKIPVDRVEALSEAFLTAGALSVDITDAYAGTSRERAQFDEPHLTPVPPWELAQLRALFEDAINVADQVARALVAAGLDPAHCFDVDRVEDRDWVRATQMQFKPIQISPRLWVVPSWHAPPDPHAINLTIDPGQAFGTGTHPTTRLCLEWLSANLAGGEAVLDYGCGSGILAIAALKLGAAFACGVDIDSAALETARHNAIKNHVLATFESAERPLEASFDIVMANILAAPLQLLAPLIARATRKGGDIVLSGILEHQKDEVLKCYREWFTMRDPYRREEWVLLHGKRNSS